MTKTPKATTKTPRWEDYPRPSIAVDLAVLTVHLQERISRNGRKQLPVPTLRVLLVQRGEDPFRDRWALPGGFLRPKETLEEAAERELAEETGLKGMRPHLHPLRTYSDIGRDPRGWVLSAAYRALVRTGEAPPLAGSDASAARWCPVAEAQGLTLAFDHGRILADALDEVALQATSTLVVREFLPETFVLAELDQVLRCLAPGRYDEQLPNLRRKVLAKGVLEPTGQSEPRYSQRPAQLFRFTGTIPDTRIF